MTIWSRLLIPVLLLASSGSIRAEYIAENGRTEKQQVNLPVADDSAQDAGSGVYELSPADVYFPDVEKALRDSKVDRIAVQSEGVNTSLRTFAEIEVSAVTGRSKFNGQDPLFTALGMIYQNRLWIRVPMIPIESPKLARLFGLDPKAHHRVSGVWLMKNERARPLIMAGFSDSPDTDAGLDSETKDALKKLRFRLMTFMNMPGEFKIVPLQNAQGAWVAPIELTQTDLVTDEQLVEKIRSADMKAQPYGSALALDAALKRAFEEHKVDGLQATTYELLNQLDGSPDYMAPRLRELDHLVTTVRPFQKSAWLYFAAFLAFVGYLVSNRRLAVVAPAGMAGQGEGAAREAITIPSKTGETERLDGDEGGVTGGTIAGMIVSTSRGAKGGLAQMVASVEAAAIIHSHRTYADPVLAYGGPKGGAAWNVAFIFYLVAGAALIAALVTRFMLGGRMPVSNMYESITFSLGAFTIVGIVFEGIYRQGWIGAVACLFGWVLMTMANGMPLHMRKVEPLVAVLNSVWLNFHVTSLLISYSAFLLAFAFGVLFFAHDFVGDMGGVLPRRDLLEYMIYRAVQVGWPLLTLGIFLGAVWANTAWGSYWSWDPKETWALITWFTYTIYLHLRMNIGWTGRKSVAASMVGFAMVLITYFGVSYLPGISGGMHSYAEPISK